MVGDTRMKGKPFSNDIYMVSIGSNKGMFQDQNKSRRTPSDPVMFFDCGIHAREWISSTTCLYLIQVLQGPDQTSSVLCQKLVNAFEHKRVSKRARHYPIYNIQWIWMPMMNPDGYALTHEQDKLGEGEKSSFLP